MLKFEWGKYDKVIKKEVYKNRKSDEIVEKIQNLAPNEYSKETILTLVENFRQMKYKAAKHLWFLALALLVTSSTMTFVSLQSGSGINFLNWIAFVYCIIMAVRYGKRVE